MTRRGLSFPRVYRLARKSDFDRVLQHAQRRLREGSLRAYVLQNTVDHARLGIIIGRRQAQSAVIRNRVKRLTRESFRLRCTGFGAIDVVVQVLSVTGTDETKAALAALWDRIESANVENVENDASNA